MLAALPYSLTTNRTFQRHTWRSRVPPFGILSRAMIRRLLGLPPIRVAQPFVLHSYTYVHMYIPLWSGIQAPFDVHIRFRTGVKYASRAIQYRTPITRGYGKTYIVVRNRDGPKKRIIPYAYKPYLVMIIYYLIRTRQADIYSTQKTCYPRCFGSHSWF